MTAIEKPLTEKQIEAALARNDIQTFAALVKHHKAHHERETSIQNFLQIMHDRYPEQFDDAEKEWNVQEIFNTLHPGETASRIDQLEKAYNDLWLVLVSLQNAISHVLTHPTELPSDIYAKREDSHGENNAQSKTD